jgi:hypothetical protein
VAFGIYSGDKASYDENIAASFPTSSDGICVSLSMFLYVTRQHLCQPVLLQDGAQLTLPA